MAVDVAMVLNSSLSWGTQYAVMDNVCWAWTEIDGKKVGCRYWTVAALAAKIADSRAKLVHEHAVPRSVIIRLLKELKAPTSETVFELLDKLLIAVIVTQEQDRQLSEHFSDEMPSAFYEIGPSFHDPWLRHAPFHSIEGFQRRELSRATCRQILKLGKLQAEADMLIQGR